MKIRNLFLCGPEYTSNVYLVTGTWNALTDVNTLVDVGRDPAIIDEIMAASTGVGKKRVERVILTHSHYDHTSLLPRIHELFAPKVYAASASLPGVDVILKGGEHLKMGDRDFEVIATPGHSNDSICLYCAEDRVLFAGDTPVIIRTPDGSYTPEFIDALEIICSKTITAVYFGHGPPLLEQCNELLKTSLKNVRRKNV
jgi:glyoxylase-like metal-dependent hydrolase (beta-lactamase superfamily II)